MTAKRDVGEMGETFASHLALEANIVVNRAHSDKRGWDLLFELPHMGAPRAPMPLDRRPGRLVARVQVKSGDHKTLKGRTDAVIGKVTDIKLSNWEELIKWPQPAFYLVLDYEGGPRPQHAFLIHVGDDLIRKVLERLRKEALKDPEIVSKLHEKTMQLTWTEAERISPIDGSSLISAIERHVADGQHAYVLHKMETLRDAGYNAGDRFHLKLQTGPQGDASALSALVDFAIGVRPSVVVNEAAMFDNRFQLPFKVEDLMAVDAETRLAFTEGPPELATICVRLENNDGSRRVESTCRLFDSALLFPWFPEIHRKRRLVSDNFDIILSRNGEIQLTVKLPPSPDGKHELEIAARHAMALRIVVASPSDGIALILMNDGEERRLVGFTPPRVSAEVASTIDPLLHAHGIARILHIDPKTYVSVDWLVEHAQQLAHLHWLLSLVTSREKLRVTIEPIAEDSPEGLNIGIVMVSAVRISIDDIAFLVGVAHGRAAQTPDDQEWYAPLQLHIIRQGVLRPGPDVAETLRAYSEAAERWMESNEISNISSAFMSNDTTNNT